MKLSEAKKILSRNGYLLEDKYMNAEQVDIKNTAISNDEIDQYALEAARIYMNLDKGLGDNFTEEEYVEIMKSRSDIVDYIENKIPATVFAHEMLDIELMQNCIDSCGY